MEMCLVAQEESGFWIEFGKSIWYNEGIPPYSAVPMVTWDVEMSWKGVSREEFYFITGLCHHVSFLSSLSSASLLSMHHFVAWEKARSM